MRRFILLAVVLLFSCNEEPVGWDELGRSPGEVKVLEFHPIDANSYYDYIPTGKGGNLILGRDDIYLSRSLIQFNFSSLEEKDIDSVKLILYPDTSVTDTGIRFSIYPITSSWNEYQATWLLAKSDEKWKSQGGDFDSCLIEDIVFGPESTVVDLSLKHLSLFSDTTIYGMMLISEGQGFGVFYSENAARGPKVIAYYEEEDTVLYPGQDAYIVKSNFQPLEGEFWIGSGYAYRTGFKFILDTIPTNVTVTSAEITIKPEEIISKSDTLHITVHRLLDEWDGRYTEYNTSSQGGGTFSKEDSLIEIDVRGLIQGWVSDPESNFGLLLRIYPEESMFVRIRVSPDPLLKVSYILAPKPRF